MFKKFFNNEGGATAIEYALIVSLIAVGLIFLIQNPIGLKDALALGAVIAAIITIFWVISNLITDWQITRLRKKAELSSKEDEESRALLGTADLAEQPNHEVSATKQILEDLYRQAVKQRKEAAAFWLRSRSMPESEITDDMSDEEIKDWTRVTEELHAENAVIYRQLSQRLKQITIFEGLLDNGTSFTKSELEGHQQLQEVIIASRLAHSNSHYLVLGALRRSKEAGVPLPRRLQEKVENKGPEADLDASREKRRELKRALEADELVIHQFETDLLNSYVDPAEVEEVNLSEDALTKGFPGLVWECRNWECIDFKQALVERYRQQ